jgi:hypothetical protein
MWEWRYSSAVGGGVWSALHPNRFTPGETAPGTRFIGGWVDLDVMEKKYLPLSGIEPWPSNPSLCRLTVVSYNYVDRTQLRNEFCSY